MVLYTALVETPDNIIDATLGVPRPERRLRLLDPLPVSIFLALVFMAAGLVELLTRGPVPAGYRDDDVVLIVLTVASALSLSVLWWSPLAGLIASLAFLCAQTIAGYEYTEAALVTVVAASFATVALDGWRRAIAAGFVVTAGFIIVAFTLPEFSLRDAVITWISLSVVWVVAIVVRLYRASVERAERRAALFAADREARAREAVAEERTRLARELHDSVGHALNVVVLHAGAAQRVLDAKPELVREALGNIETAGRQALGDIERMLGILRAPDEQTAFHAAPGVAQLETLCAQVREAGLPVSLQIVGEPAQLPASLDLTVYRIAQESLTNTLKHAGKTRASVTLTYAAGAVAIDVLDEGRGPAVTASAEGGRGLVGMRERVATFRGELEAGARPEGGFAVHARLPLRTEGT